MKCDILKNFLARLMSLLSIGYLVCIDWLLSPKHGNMLFNKKWGTMPCGNLFPPVQSSKLTCSEWNLVFHCSSEASRKSEGLSWYRIDSGLQNPVVLAQQWFSKYHLKATSLRNFLEMIVLDPCLEWLYKKSGGFGTEIHELVAHSSLRAC